jgi:ethanolamine-phosphate cytidylyltransferase
MPLTYDPYTAAKSLSIYRELPPHKFQDVNAETIVQRIMKGRARYEERQRRKDGKGAREGELERAEKGAAN